MKILHNPRCSKSRQTLELLKEKGFDPEIILYLENPQSKEELKGVCQKLGKNPLEITRVKEPLFKKLGLSKNDNRSDEDWLGILAHNPKLIERPIVLHNHKAAVGRPPEKVLEIL